MQAAGADGVRHAEGGNDGAFLLADAVYGIERRNGQQQHEQNRQGNAPGVFGCAGRPHILRFGRARRAALGPGRVCLKAAAEAAGERNAGHNTPPFENKNKDRKPDGTVWPQKRKRL